MTDAFDADIFDAFDFRRKRRGEHIRKPAGFGDVHREEMRFFWDRTVQFHATIEQVQG